MRHPLPPLLLGALLLAGCGGASDAGDGPPRLLLITLDTLRADRLGAWGYQRPTSPALDAFAATATRFADATCSMPTTLPSHLTLFSGLAPSEHGVRQNGVVPPRPLITLFSLLAERGVPTAGVVASKALAPRYLQGLGIGELFYGDGSTPEAVQVPGAQVTARAEAWLGEHGDGPFALWLHYFDTHEPYDPSPAAAARFTGGYDGPLPEALTVRFLVGLNDEGRGAALSPADRQHVSDLYDAEIADLDDQLERLFAFLDAQGLAASTVVVIVADHGQAHGEDGFWGHGERLLEPVIQVPLLVRLPGQREGRTVETPVETLDLLPTLGELFGLEIPAGRRGRSLLPALRGAALRPTPLRIVERRSYASDPERQGLALLGGDWKLVWYREEGEERFHLGRREGAGGLDGEDFYTPDGREAELLARVQEALAAAGDPQLPAGDDEALRALGYIN